MKTSHELMSLKKINSDNIDELIAKKEASIKGRLDSIFTDVNTAENVGSDLIYLSRLKDARLLMSAQSYKNYERAGKVGAYEGFLMEYHTGL